MNTRYILFATVLLSDCLLLDLTNVMIFLNSFKIPIQFSVCLIIFVLTSAYTLVTPCGLKYEGNSLDF